MPSEVERRWTWVPELPFDWGIRLDGTIGTSADHAKEAPPQPGQPVLRVAVFGDGVSDSSTMGLADDISVLAQAFGRDRASIEREPPSTAPTRSSESDADVEIAIHGLNLGSVDEHKLRGLIRDLIRERVAPARTEE
jgi:hypothetical protein